MELNELSLQELKALKDQAWTKFSSMSYNTKYKRQAEKEYNRLLEAYRQKLNEVTSKQ